RTCDGQRPSVVRDMAAAAQEEEVQRLVRAAVVAWNAMVHLQRARGAATVAATAAAIAMPDKSLHAGRDVLTRPLRRGAVDRPDVLRIAKRTLHRIVAHDDLGTRALLPALAAALAHRHRDLKLRPTCRFS